MNIITANLKHLYLRRLNWLVLCIFGLLAYIIAKIMLGEPQRLRPILLMPFPWLMTVGIIIASYALEVITKPMSFCMPGHRGIPRQFLFICGYLLSGFWAVCIARACQSDIETSQFIVTAIATFSLLSIAYWIAVIGLFAFNSSPLTLLLSTAWLLLDAMDEWRGFSLLAISKYPLLVILAGAAVNVSAWRVLGGNWLARKYCGKALVGFSSNTTRINREKLQQKEAKGKSHPNIHHYIEQFFISRLAHARHNSTDHYIWGGLYRSLAVPVSRCLSWKGLIFLVVSTIALSYSKILVIAAFAYVAGLIVGSVELNIRSNQLTTGSRKDRFLIGLSIALTATAITLAISAAMTGLNHLLGLVLPATIGSALSDPLFTFNHHIRSATLVLALTIPASLSINLLLKRNSLASLLCFAIITFAIINAVGIFYILSKYNVQWPKFLSSPQTMIIVIATQWLIYISLLKLICLSNRRLNRVVIYSLIALALLTVSRITWLATVKPIATVDYLAIYNQERIPANFDESKNAWPIYQQAISAYIRPQGKLKEVLEYSVLTPEELELAKPWLDENQATITILEQASLMPFYYVKREMPDSVFLSAISIHDLDNLIELSKILQVDIEYQIRENNIARVLSEIKTLDRIARHAWSEKSLVVEQMASSRLRYRTLDSAKYLLKNSRLDNDQLSELQGIVAGIAEKKQIINIEFDKYRFLDEVQRNFVPSDDGSGRIAWQADLVFDRREQLSIKEPFIKLSSCIVGQTQKQTIQQYEEMTALSGALRNMTPWQIAHEGKNITSQQFNIMKSNWFLRIECYIESGLLQASYQNHAYVQVILTAIAIHKYQLDNNNLPDSLEQLIAEGYMSELPADPFSDGPFRYEVLGNGFSVVSAGGVSFDNYPVTINEESWQELENTEGDGNE